MSDLRVGGLARLSSVDWPGELAATIFAQGCPWDCGYCHNPHLRPCAPAGVAASELVPWRLVTEFLRSRVGLLDGVVFSGGEPLAQAALPDAIAEVRDMGFRVALHTSGVSPERFAAVLPHVDWVGFDAKAPFEHYVAVTRVEGSGERARESLRQLVASSVAHEVRTTVHPDLLGEDELLELAEQLREIGVRRWVLQPFRPDGVRGGALTASPTSPPTPQLVEALAVRSSASVEVRL